MNPDWRSHLSQAGAVFRDDGSVHMGRPEAELRQALAGDLLCALPHLGLLAASGPDTAAFLQGQLTCDVRQVSPELSRLGAHCTPKGRMLATLRLFRREESYLLSLPRERAATLARRLGLYILRASTRLEDAGETLVSAGLSGPRAPALLAGVLGAAPDTVDGVLSSRGITAIRVPGNVPCFELHGDAGAMRSLWEALPAALARGGDEAWRLLRILAGVPTVHAATAEAFVPQMTNLERLGGVSFRKGCYTGQEVVARTHYLGKLKRRMYLARVDAPVPPAPGDEVYAAGTGAAQSAGRLVDACPHPQGGYAVLAVILSGEARDGAVHLGSLEGPLLRMESLPYEVEVA